MKGGHGRVDCLRELQLPLVLALILKTAEAWCCVHNVSLGAQVGMGRMLDDCMDEKDAAKFEGCCRVGLDGLGRRQICLPITDSMSPTPGRPGHPGRSVVSHGFRMCTKHHTLVVFLGLFFGPFWPAWGCRTRPVQKHGLSKSWGGHNS